MEQDIRVENLQRMNDTLWKMIFIKNKYQIWFTVWLQMYSITHMLYNNIYNEYWIIVWIKHIDGKTMYYVNWNWHFEDVIYLIKR